MPVNYTCLFELIQSILHFRPIPRNRKLITVEPIKAQVASENRPKSKKN